MISHTKFPSIYDPSKSDLFSPFNKYKVETIYNLEAGARMMASIYNNIGYWKQETGLDNYDDIYKFFLSSEISLLFDGWTGGQHSDIYYPISSNIPVSFEDASFYSSFGSDDTTLVLNLNADSGSVADSSIYGTNAEMFVDGITVEHDPCYGNTFKINTSIGGKLPNLLEFGPALSMNLSTNLSDDEYGAIVFAKLGQPKSLEVSRYGNVLTISDIQDGVVPIFNVTYDGLKAYGMELSIGQSRNMKFKVFPVSDLDGEISLSNVHQLESGYQLSDLFERWTMYAVSLTRDEYPLLNNPSSHYVCRQFLGSTYDTAFWNGMDRAVSNSGGAVNGNFISGEFVGNSLNDAQNKPIFIANFRSESYGSSFGQTPLVDSKPCDEREGEDSLKIYGSPAEKFGFQLVSSGGLPEDNNTIYRMFPNAEFKFIKVFRRKFNQRRSPFLENYVNYVFSPLKKHLLKYSIDAEDETSGVVEDGSIGGKYFHLTGQKPIDLNSTPLYGKNLLSCDYVAFEAWLSCKDFSNVDVFKDSNSSYGMTLSTSGGNSDMSFIGSTATSSYIGQIFQTRFNDGNSDEIHSFNYANEAYEYGSKEDPFNYPIDLNHILPFWISDDEKWHHVVVSHRQLSNGKRVVTTYIDGRSASRTYGSHISTEGFFLTNIEQDNLTSYPTPGNTLILNPRSSEFNLKYLRCYFSDSPRVFLQDQDILNLYAEGCNQYKPNSDGFIVKQYYCAGDIGNIQNMILSHDNRRYYTNYNESMASERQLVFSNSVITYNNLSSYLSSDGQGQSPGKYFNGFEKSRFFPGTYSGYPCIENSFLMEISGNMAISSQGDYLMHVLANSMLSLEFSKNGGSPMGFVFPVESASVSGNSFDYSDDSSAPVGLEALKHSIVSANFDDGNYVVKGLFGAKTADSLSASLMVDMKKIADPSSVDLQNNSKEAYGDGSGFEILTYSQPQPPSESIC